MKSQPDVYLKVLERAVEACGGIAGVGLLLDVPGAQVGEWLGRGRPIPTRAFLRLVDYLMDGERGGSEEVRMAPRAPLLLPVVRETAEQALEEALRLHQTGIGNVQLLNGRGVLEIAAHRGFGPAFLAYFGEVGPGEPSVCSRALASASPIFVADVRMDPELCNTAAAGAIVAAGVCSVQSTPLVSARGHVFGMISTHFVQPGGAHPGLPSLAPIARRFANILEHWVTPAIESSSAPSALP